MFQSRILPCNYVTLFFSFQRTAFVKFCKINPKYLHCRQFGPENVKESAPHTQTARNKKSGVKQSMPKTVTQQIIQTTRAIPIPPKKKYAQNAEIMREKKKYARNAEIMREIYRRNDQVIQELQRRRDQLVRKFCWLISRLMTRSRWTVGELLKEFSKKAVSHAK